VAGKRRADGPAKKKTASAKAAPAGWRPRARRFLKWGVVLGLVLSVLGVAAVVVVYKAIDIPNPNAEFETETTHVLFADGKTELGRFALQNRTSIPYSEMPDTVKNAVVAAEDRSFWTNPGIDIKGVLRAAFSNASGNNTQGASTITQQYVKILYLTSERSYKRKVKEAVVARKLAEEQTKEQVLEGYLNTIYFGRGAYGIQAAAQAYFGVPAKQLTLRQSAVLASVINNPTQFDPANGKENTAALLGRFQYILNGMAEMGELDAAQADRAKKRLPAFPKVQGQQAYAGQRGHALELVKKELLRLGVVTEEQINGGGLKVTTTLTKKAMDAAQAGIDEVRPKGLRGLHAAVASVEPGTGSLRGFFGGQDYLDSQINWALTGGQPGSAFKPFALAAGLKDGFSLKDTFDGNSPFYYNEAGTGDRVRNEGSGSDGLGTDYGAKVNLVKATEESINTAFADLTVSIPDGPEEILKTATQLGIPKWNKKLTSRDHLRNSPGLEPVSGIALGSATISPINMANAYGTIANGGERADVYVIEKVEDRTGEVLYRHKVHTKPVLDDDVAADVSYAMQGVVQNGTGTNAQSIGRPAAGKTGTATNDLDQVSSSWFVGYTPQMATAVMYVRGDGNDQLDGWLPSYNGLEGYFGANYPTRTWAAVMGRILDGTEVEDFPPPANVDGEAPDDGHAPYTPPPKPTRQPSKKPTESESPTASESPTVSESPTETPTTKVPGPDCTLFPDHPQCTESPSETPTDGGSGGSGGVLNREYSREEQTSP
jgi:membrane peptidoglycan carboxypeptidase